MTIYNKTTGNIYSAILRMWNEEQEQYDPDILQDIDTDMAKKWDPMFEMYVMDQAELDAWEDFWADEVSDAIEGRSDLLDGGDYIFICEKED